MMTIDGVQLTTRTPHGGFGRMLRAVAAIAAMYEAPASNTVAAIYEDDKSCAFFEIDLAADLPRRIGETFAAEVRGLFRTQGGYNGLVIRLRGKRLVDDGPWWNEPDLRLA